MRACIGKRISAAVTAALILIAAFSAAGFFNRLFSVAGVASAAQPAVYRIVKQTENGAEIIKILNSSDEIIYSENTFDPQRAKTAIESDRNGADYTLDIPAPAVSLGAEVNIKPYNPSSDSFTLKAESSHFLDVSFDIDGYDWAYKPSEAQNFIDIGTGSGYGEIAFGKGLSVGRYDVRVRIYGALYFDGMSFKTRVGEKDVQITVTESGSYEFYSQPSAELTYGQSLSEIDWSASTTTSGGEWTLSDSDQNAVLSAGKHMIKADFSPYNPNYGSIEAVDVSLEIKPYEVKVAIDDKSSAKGEPLLDLTCEVLTQTFPAGDTEEDLQINLTTDADPQLQGIYSISGSLGNPNYRAVFVSSSDPDTQFPHGGTYIVTAYSLSGWANGINIDIQSKTGFTRALQIGLETKSISVPAGVVGEPLASFVFDIQNEYGVRLTDFPDGISVTLDFSEAWPDADTVLYRQGEIWERAEIEDGKAVLELNYADGFIILKTERGLLSDPPVDWNEATIALGCASVLLFAAVIAIYLKYFGGKRDV